MNTPEAHSITVVENDGNKKFLLPDGSLHEKLLAGKYSSYLPYKSTPHQASITTLDKEIDTPFLVFRDGRYYDSGILDRIFGSDGYYVVSGLRRFDLKDLALQWLHADWFEAGDVITFVRIPSNYEVQRRSLAK